MEGRLNKIKENAVINNFNLDTLLNNIKEIINSTRASLTDRESTLQRQIQTNTGNESELIQLRQQLIVQQETNTRVNGILDLIEKEVDRTNALMKNNNFDEPFKQDAINGFNEYINIVPDSTGGKSTKRKRHNKKHSKGKSRKIRNKKHKSK
jgi:hypothetical protein